MTNNSFKDYEKRINKEFKDSFIFTDPKESFAKRKRSP